MTDNDRGWRQRVRRHQGYGGAWLASIVVLLAVPQAVRACDLCAIYTTTETRQETIGPYAGVAEQYTYFATLKDNGRAVENTDDQRLRSSITQVIAGYQVHPRIGLQLNFPIIARTFRRPTEDGIQNGHETGIGDMSVIANVKAFSWADTERVAHLYLFGGLKFPTGDPSALSEELNEGQDEPPPEPTACSSHMEGCAEPSALRVPVRVRPQHAMEAAPTEVASGIHGHDIALGSGSVDGIVGGQVFGSWKRAFATAAIQYVARTVGAFGYQYANDLLFETGPGAFLLLGDALLGEPYSLGGQILFSGETKGNDTLDGEKAGDTGITALYLGPAFRFSWGTHLGSEIGADLPVLQNNTQLQIVPDYRLRGGISWRF